MRNNEITGVSPTRTRATPKLSPNELVMIRAIKALRRVGIRLSNKWSPGQGFEKGVFEEIRAEQRRPIANLLASCEEVTLWTPQDIARALGLDARNSRVLGQIGKDCVALGAQCYGQVRLKKRANRVRVYSLDDIGDMTLDEIREIYATESSQRKLSQSTSNR
jgi:hypothetical protein